MTSPQAQPAVKTGIVVVENVVIEEFFEDIFEEIIIKEVIVDEVIIKDVIEKVVSELSRTRCSKRCQQQQLKQDRFTMSLWRHLPPLTVTIGISKLDK